MNDYIQKQWDTADLITKQHVRMRRVVVWVVSAAVVLSLGTYLAQFYFAR